MAGRDVWHPVATVRAITMRASAESVVALRRPNSRRGKKCPNGEPRRKTGGVLPLVGSSTTPSPLSYATSKHRQGIICSRRAKPRTSSRHRISRRHRLDVLRHRDKAFRPHVGGGRPDKVSYLQSEMLNPCRPWQLRTPQGRNPRQRHHRTRIPQRSYRPTRGHPSTPSRRRKSWLRQTKPPATAASPAPWSDHLQRLNR
jgi:hypothetical protein